MINVVVNSLNRPATLHSGSTVVIVGVEVGEEYYPASGARKAKALFRNVLNIPKKRFVRMLSPVSESLPQLYVLPQFRLWQVVPANRPPDIWAGWAGVLGGPSCYQSPNQAIPSPRDTVCRQGPFLSQ